MFLPHTYAAEMLSIAENLAASAKILNGLDSTTLEPDIKATIKGMAISDLHECRIALMKMASVIIRATQDEDDE